jgi:hypothetical protein
MIYKFSTVLLDIMGQIVNGGDTKIKYDTLEIYGFKLDISFDGYFLSVLNVYSTTHQILIKDVEKSIAFKISSSILKL